ncbi:hypothetical protein Pelo_17278 [Pelomyxa schiedti]|nr:hypothetical protein Pelo_17278 [Pelomyxa schiedti]
MARRVGRSHALAAEALAVVATGSPLGMGFSALTHLKRELEVVLPIEDQYSIQECCASIPELRQVCELAMQFQSQLKKAALSLASLDKMMYTLGETTQRNEKLEICVTSQGGGMYWKSNLSNQGRDSAMLKEHLSIDKEGLEMRICPTSSFSSSSSSPSPPASLHVLQVSRVVLDMVVRPGWLDNDRKREYKVCRNTDLFRVGQLHSPALAASPDTL